MTRTRLNWPPILERAAAIVRSYDTPVTLRQLHYQLVSQQIIPNDQNAYKRLSELTAEARRDGDFPDLEDRGRAINQAAGWDSPEQAMQTTARYYRVDRTLGQEFAVYLGVEKAGMLAQLRSWFDGYGVPVLALGGYASQTYKDQVRASVLAQERPSVLVYAGDFDPSGEDILRDFLARTNCWDHVVQVALTADQVAEHDLPVSVGKATDSRADGFIREHGGLYQVELDALDPTTLRGLYQGAVDALWDYQEFERVLAREDRERQALIRLAELGVPM